MRKGATLLVAVLVIFAVAVWLAFKDLETDYGLLE
jgi:hypothetical protein